MCESVLETHSLPLACLRTHCAQLQGRLAEGGEELMCNGTLGKTGEDAVNFEPTSSPPHHTLTGVTHPPVHTHSSRGDVPSISQPIQTSSGTTSLWCTVSKTMSNVLSSQRECRVLNTGHSYWQERTGRSGSGLSRTTVSVSSRTQEEEERKRRRRRVLTLTRSFRQGYHGDDTPSCQTQWEQEKERFLQFLG